MTNGRVVGWTRSARLNCYGDEFEEMRERLDVEPATTESERRELQAEIDAAAFHAYGLSREETEFVLYDFHQVENPRVMDDAYFEMVKEKYGNSTETASDGGASGMFLIQLFARFTRA